MAVEVDYRRHLPYGGSAVDGEAIALLEDIRAGLAQSILAADFPAGAFFWLKQLHRYLNLKHPITLPERIELCNVLYAMFSAKDIDLGFQSTVSALLARILKKKEILENSGLVLDWHPFLDVLQTLYFPQRRNRVFVDEKKHGAAVMQLASYARRYFSPKATEEMLDEFRPLLVPLENDIYFAQGFLVRFLPLHDVDQINTWLPEIMQVWEWIQNLPNWDLQWMDLISRAAKENIGKIDWNPYLPQLFTVGLRLFGLPVGTSNPPPPQQHDVAPNFGIFMKTGKDKTQMLAKFIISTLQPNSDTFEHLSKLFQAIESFFHPSNSGSWTMLLTSLLQHLSTELVDRVKDESDEKCTTPKSDRLSVEKQRQLAELLLPLVFLTMFGKSTIAIMSAHTALRNLAFIAPDLVFPQLLERVGPALDSLTETHRTLSVIGAIGAVARPVFSRNRYPEGSLHVVNLLELTLPGIDMNDPMKAFSALQLITNVASTVSFGNAMAAKANFGGGQDWTELDYEIAATTAEPMENWLQGYLTKLFQLFENFPEENGKTTKTSMESGLSRMVSHTNDALFDALLPDYFDFTVNKLVNFIGTSVIPSARKVVGMMCRSIACAYPERSLKKLLTLACSRIIEEVDSGSGADPQSPEEADRALMWFQTMAYFSIKQVGAEILKFKDLIQTTLRKTLPLKRSKVHKLAGKLLRNTLKCLTSIYPIESRLVPLNVWESKEFVVNHFKYWGSTVDLQKPQIIWHQPTQEEINFAMDLIREFVLPDLVLLESTAKTREAKPLVPTALLHAITTLRNGLIGMAVLAAPLEKEKGISAANDDVAMDVDPPVDEKNIADGETGHRPSRYRVLNCGYCVPPSNEELFNEIVTLRDRIGTLLHNLVDYCSVFREDDNKTVRTLVKVIGIYLSNRGGNSKKSVQSLRGYQYLKTYMRDSISPSKGHARSIFVMRIWILHMFRLSYNAITVNPSAIERNLLKDLMQLSVYNSYAEVRKKAQTTLSVAMGCFPNQKYQILENVLQAIQTKEHKVIKGALHTIRQSPLMNTCLRLWKYQSLFMLALCQAQFDEKPSAQELIRKVFNDFMNKFQRLSITSTSYENIRELATSMLAKSMNSPLAGIAGVRDRPSVDNRVIYRELVESLVGLLKKSGLHWRFEMMTANCISLILRADADTDLPLEWFYASITSDLPQARTLAMSTITRILFLVKEPADEDDQSMEDNKSPRHRYKIQTGLQHAQIDRERSIAYLAAMQQAHTDPTNALANHFVDQKSVGWLYWPTDYIAYAPQVSRGASRTDFHLAALDALVSTQQFWDKTLALLSQESDSKENANQYNGYHVEFIKGVARHYGPSILAPLKPSLAKLTSTITERSSQRAAAEIVAGLVRGCKQWTLEQTNELAECLSPLLTAAFDNVTPDTLRDWETSLCDAMLFRDPRRVKWFIDLLFNATADPERAYSFSEARKFSFKRAVLEAIGWRVHERCLALLNELEVNMAHQYKHVRDQLSMALHEVFTTTWHPLLYGQGNYHPVAVHTFVQNLIRSLETEREVSRTIPAEEALSQPTTYTRLSKSVCIWVFTAMNSIRPHVMFPYLASLLPHLFLMVDNNDHDLQTMAKSVLLIIPQQVFPRDLTAELLSQLVHISRSSSWHVRIRVLPALQIFLFRNLFHFTEGMINTTLDLLMALLEDSQVEVRELAGQTLSGVIRCASRSAIARLKDHFSRLLAVKIAKKKPEPEAVLKRHVGVLGLSAIVLAFPYDLPQWMPEVLETLARHINDPAPIQTTVKHTMGDFRRTHQDTWHTDREKFTDDQLFVLTELMVGQSYYA